MPCFFPHIVFSGGGTGGHLFPGLAVAERLRCDMPHARITFAGSGKDFERQHVARTGFEYVALDCHPLPKRPYHLPRFVTKNLSGLRAARRLIRREQVTLVVGLGGFASVVAARAATRSSIPLFLLEQNVVPGRANLWLSRWAETVCVAFEDSVRAFPESVSTVVTGTPIAAGFSSASARPEDSRPRQLLVLGGSGGARQLNEHVPEAISLVGQPLASWHLVHQTGEADADSVRGHYRRLGISAVVKPFLNDMPDVLAETSLAVCRAGGSTLAELAATGVPAILVPYPHAARDHQRHNALALVRRGACQMIDPRESGGSLRQRLSRDLLALVTDAQAQEEMAISMAQQGRSNAASDICGLIQERLERFDVARAA